MSVTTASSAPSERIALKRLLWVGPLAVVAAAAANAILRALALALLDIAPNFFPLRSPTFIPFTVIGVTGAVIVFALVARFARRPIRAFRIIAVVALFISFLPDLGLLLGGGRSPAPGGPSIGGANALSVGTLILMHVVAAAISVGLLTTLTRENRIERKSSYGKTQA